MKQSDRFFVWAIMLALLFMSNTAAHAGDNAPASLDTPAVGAPFPVTIPLSTNAQGAHSVRTADLDNDGDTDVIVASREDGQITWYENLGTQPATFATRVLATAAGSYMAIPADFNGDGWQDIAVVAVGVIDPATFDKQTDEAVDAAATQGAGKLFWLQNLLAQGQGFAPRSVAEGLNYPVAVYAADLNNDSALDMVVATRDDGRVSWFENNGDGSAFSTRLLAANLPGAAAVQAGDIDADGHMDVVAAAEDTNQIVWLRNNGAQPPNFEPRTVSERPQPPTGQDFAKSVFVADLDNDGDPDIVFASEQENKIGWYENLGRGSSFTEHVVATDMLHAKSVYAVDIDWDGDVDILAAAAESGVVTLYENKRGKPPTFVAHLVKAGAMGAHSVVAADIDKDGDIDILSASRDDNSVLLYPNLASHRTALFDQQTQYVVSTYREPRMAAGVDLDNDGDVDIISVADQTVAWHRNDGGLPPKFTRFEISQTLSGGRWIHAADIDDDGDQDLFVADTVANRILWYENQLPAPGATPAFVEHLITDHAKGVRDVHSADMDGDGDLDLYSASDADNTIAWYEQKRGAAITFERRIVTNEAKYARSSFAADMNLDGAPDLMSASADDNVVAWYENLGGSPLGWAVRNLSRTMDGARHIYAGDVDGDGDTDIVAGAERNNTIAWYENRRGSPATFVTHIVSEAATGVHAIITGDADHDGDLDIFAALEAGNRLVWYENDGAPQPSFTEHTIATNFNVAHSISLADVDQDGDLDVIAASRAGGQVAWFENIGGQYAISQSELRAPNAGLQVLLNLTFANRGRAGDAAMRVNALTLRFTTTEGRPLTPAEAAAFFADLAVYQDSNFDGVLNLPQDQWLAAADSLSLDGNGQLLIPLPSEQAGVQIDPGGAARYFVAATVLNNRCLTSDSVQITHIPNALTVVNQQTGYRMSGEYMRGIDILNAPQDTTQLGVVINEIMADNTHTLEDPNEPQEYPDWIELYNPAAVPVNLGGMFLTDDPANAQLFRIPDGVVIGAKGFLVFIADGEPEQGPLHTNFRLSKGGESVTLIDKAARSFRLLDQVKYDGMVADVTYGRYPNGGPDWKILGAATPGAYNMDQLLVITANVYAPLIANGTACR